MKLAIRDHDYPDHRMYFVKVMDGALLEEAQTSPEFAIIPSSNCLEIFAEKVESILLALAITSLNFVVGIFKS